jgi:membrane protein required for colicin V production
MNMVDVSIVLLLALSAVLGFRSGLIQSVFSLLGLIAGIAIASWNYKRLADELYPLTNDKSLSEAIWFCLLALAVMLVGVLIGLLVKKLIHGIGLAWLDRVTGLIFGLLRGALLVVLCIVTLVAFFPETKWLGDARLAKYFLGTAHLTTQMTPADLKEKIQSGLRVLEKDSPEWLKKKINL